MRAAARLIRLIVTVLGYTSWAYLRTAFYPREKRIRARAQYQHRGTQMILNVLKVRVTTGGTWPESGPIIVAANHIGVLDPFVLASKIPLALAAKLEISKWPVAGWVAHTMGVIFVDRRRTSRAVSFVDGLRERLRLGIPVGVFPEGTTNMTPELLPFKTGAFQAVVDMPDGQVLPAYVRPVEVDGNPLSEDDRELVSWDDPSLSFGAHVWQLLTLKEMHFHVDFGAPIEAAGRDRKELARLAHDQVKSLQDTSSNPAGFLHSG